jgi:acetyl-CoA acetyltransferase
MESQTEEERAAEQDRRTQRSSHTLRHARRRSVERRRHRARRYAIEAALERAEVKPDQVQHVVMGQVLQAGQGQLPSRQAQIKAGIPKEVSWETINKVCASSLRAVGRIDQAVRAGGLELAVAGGMESMSGAPYAGYRSRGLELRPSLRPPN